VGNSKIMIERPESIFCAITHGLYEPWIDILHSGQTPTWLSNNFIEGFEVHHFHGVPGNSLIIKYDKFHEKLRWTNRWVAMPLRKFDQILGFPFRHHIPKQKISRRINLKHPVIEINIIDIYATMKWKDLAILEYFIKHSSSNYLFMTTTSSYIRPAKLSKLVADLPRTELYAGAVAYAGADFAAGNNRLFSRDVVKKILDNRKKLDCGVIEDVALGNLCKVLRIPLIELPKCNISSLEELSSLTDVELKNNYHFRLKSGTISERNDTQIMNELHKRFEGIDEKD